MSTKTAKEQQVEQRAFALFLDGYGSMTECKAQALREQG